MENVWEHGQGMLMDAGQSFVGEFLNVVFGESCFPLGDLDRDLF